MFQQVRYRILKKRRFVFATVFFKRHKNKCTLCSQGRANDTPLHVCSLAGLFAAFEIKKLLLHLKQMDVEAVSYASNDFLQELGLETRGDLFALKAFCQRRVSTSRHGQAG